MVGKCAKDCCGAVPCAMSAIYRHWCGVYGEPEYTKDAYRWRWSDYNV